MCVITDKFKSVEDASGYPAAWFFVAACIMLTGVLTFIGGAKLLVDLVGFVYPAYMSFKSMDTNAGDDTQWLTYWIVFSFVSIVETMLSFVTALIPMYFWLKIAMIVVRNTPGAFSFESRIYLRCGYCCVSYGDVCSPFFYQFSVDVVPKYSWCTNHL